MERITDSKIELLKLLEGFDAAKIKLLRSELFLKKGYSESFELKMFDILTKEKDKSDDYLRKKLKVKSAAQYSIGKRKLFENILGFVTSNNFEANGRGKIAKLQFLLEHRLLKTCERYIGEVKTEALYFQHFYDYLEVLKTEYELILLSEDKNTVEKLKLQEKLIHNVTQNINSYEQLSQVFRKLLLKRSESNNRIEGGELAEVKELLKDLQNIQDESLSQPVLKILYHTNIALAKYLGSLQIENTTVCSVINLWQQQPQLILEFPGLFLDGIFTIFYIDFLHGDVPAAIEHYHFFDQMSAMLTGTNKLKRDVIIYHTKMKIYHKTGDYETLRTYMNDNNKVLQKAEKCFTTNQNLPFLTSVCISYFVLEDYKKADELIYRIKDMNKAKLRMDVYYFTMIFHLLIMYELKDWYRLHLNVEAAYQQLYQAKVKRPFEKELMLFLKKFPVLNSGKNIPREIPDFFNRLEYYANDPVRKQYFLYFNYYLWFRSKVEGISYMKFMKNRLQGGLKFLA